MKRRALIATVGGLAAGALSVPAFAQDGYPRRPIRVIVPFAPGGVVDVTARLLTQRMSERLGWQFVVDNRPGGNGFIAVTAAARSAPDGYTLLAAHTGEFSVNPALFREVPYDLERDFVPVTMISDTPMLLVASAQSGLNTFAEVIARARQEPGALAFSSPGTGSVNHLAGEWLASAAGIQLLHVPFRGGAPAVAAVAGGMVPLSVVAVPAALPHIQSDRVRVIGLTTASRTPLDRSWSTAQEAGIPAVNSSNWVGLFAPRGVPPEIPALLYRAVRETLETADTRARFAELGAVVGGMPPTEFAARIRQDLSQYRDIIATARITPD